jgi:hypothetical protein
MILLVQSFQSKAGPATGFFERNYYGMIGTTYDTFYVTQAAMILLKLFLLGENGEKLGYSGKMLSQLNA